MKTTVISMTNNFLGVYDALKDIITNVVVDLKELFVRVEKLEQQPCACSDIARIIQEQNQRVDKVDERMQKLEQSESWTLPHWQDTFKRLDLLEKQIEALDKRINDDYVFLSKRIVFLKERLKKFIPKEGAH